MASGTLTEAFGVPREMQLAVHIQQFASSLSAVQGNSPSVALLLNEQIDPRADYFLSALTTNL